MKHSDDFRKAATECLALAQKTADADARLSLLMMAEKFFELANAPTVGTDYFDAALQEFNDEQMSGH